MSSRQRVQAKQGQDSAPGLPSTFCQRWGAQGSPLGWNCFSLCSSEAEHLVICSLAVRSPFCEMNLFLPPVFFLFSFFIAYHFVDLRVPCF